MDLFYLDNIKEEMKEQKKKQKDLAEVLKVKPTTISKYFNGSRRLTIDDFIIICEFLNKTPNELLNYKYEEE